MLAIWSICTNMHRLFLYSLPNVQPLSQSDSNVQQTRDYERSRGSKMFGWIRTSHEAQVQSPAALGLGQVEMTLQHSMLTLWNSLSTLLHAKKTSSRATTMYISFMKCVLSCSWVQSLRGWESLPTPGCISGSGTESNDWMKPSSSQSMKPCGWPVLN